MNPIFSALLHKKWLVLAPALFALFATTGCDLRFSFSVLETFAEQQIDGNPVMGTLSGTTNTWSMNVTQQSQYQNENFDRVRGIIITGVKLSIRPESNDPAHDPIEDGNDDDWSFLSSVELFIRATIDGTLEEERVAHILAGSSQFDAGNTVLEFTVTEVELLPFIQAPDGYEVELRVTGNVPPDNVLFDGEVKYRVTAVLFR